MQEEQQLTKRQRRLQKKQEQQEKRTSEANKKKMTTLIVIVVIVLVVGGLVYLAIGGTESSDSTQLQNVNGQDVGNNPFLGGIEAKVVITEFSDFSCPACASVAPVLKQLVDKYGDQIRLVFNSFDLSHTWSKKSLEAGECAHQQGGFWQYHDLIFSKQSDWTSANDAVDKFKSYAQQVGLNEEAFNNCLDSNLMSSEVARDTSVGRDKKVSATPTFYINDQELVGVKPLSEFSRIIDEELAKN